MSVLRVRKSSGYDGEIRVPGDKSVSHRAVMLGALAEGETRIRNFLPGEDCLSTIACFRALGVEIETAAAGGTRAVEVVVHGRGLDGLAEPGDVLDAGNSGTTMRLLLGILAGQPFFSVITGDGSLRGRPMGRVTEPLRRMGARIWGRGGGALAPLAVQGGELQSGDFDLPVASAQVKSALLLAGLRATGETVIREPHPSRDHTERMLRHFGVAVRAEPGLAAVRGPARLQARTVHVPGDISSAAFFLVAGSIVPGSRVRLPRVGLNPTRTGVIEVLRGMGALIAVDNLREEGGEPVGDLEVRHAPLKGVTIGGAMIPRLVDEIPILAVAAISAEGVTEIRDAAELRVKESDRLAAVARELGRLGAEVEELPDGLRIHGGRRGGRGGRRLRGASCQAEGDHRMAMALAVAGLIADGETSVAGADCAAVSFPGFTEQIARFL